MANVKRTTINLDVGLLDEAREVLGTRNTTDTVHEAMREAVRRERLRSLLEWDLTWLTPERLTAIRHGARASDL